VAADLSGRCPSWKRIQSTLSTPLRGHATASHH
jgi:hypothetical protein